MRKPLRRGGRSGLKALRNSAFDVCAKKPSAKADNSERVTLLNNLNFRVRELTMPVTYKRRLLDMNFAAENSDCSLLG